MTNCAIKFEFPKYLEKFNRARERIELTIASTIQVNIGFRFDREGAWNGHEKWAPLKRRIGQILSVSGTLRKSISPPGAPGIGQGEGFVTVSGPTELMQVDVGTKVKYAAIHNDGGIVRHPGTKNGFGRGILIPPHAIPIPRRNFTDWNETDETELSETLSNLIADILESA